jgi:hypothetical protein
MRDRLVDLLEKADLALGSAAGVVDDEELAPLIDSVRAVRTRLAYPEDVLVAAFAGGTGSGKSSLFNAIIGDEVAEAGGIRPTTSHVAAVVPEEVGPAMDGYLDLMAVEERHRYAGPRVCLLDLPDTDSVEGSHRYRVDRVLPLVDVVIWVTDPQKYRDARLHVDYIGPMARYGGQLVFVLNQADRLDPSALNAVVSDFSRALADDGVSDPVVVVTSAAPPSGPPEGHDDLLAALEERRSGSGLYDKLLSDVEEAGRKLGEGIGGALDFDARAEEALGSAVQALLDREVPAASRMLTAFLDALVAETGGEISARLEGVAAEVPRHLERIQGQLETAPEPRRRRFLRRHLPRSPVEPDPCHIRALVAPAVIRPARVILAKRALAAASVADLTLEVARLRESDRR